ncbi:tannase/feruloyl esterase family alpha/beta hydrolase [Sphingomonas sp. AR_OL41]|uniref:tannase/feruloyl esterase family alpha/beta hydrolase n=1 Tax=Sphingomonas sp. AR_OL41 TaxID=3042729 RepID=UPI002480B407|nr:tannase/feruloyl esterase family alpha/beta hydrolase [Sphingomonas sp. AR_OL41]MDH7973241.1 tannase/feruloyl esterase family alpha/beta hydrolase [Sphingomonas sp. AR_OL41]
MRALLRLLVVAVGLCLAMPALAQQPVASPLAGAAKIVLDAERCEALAGGRFQRLAGAATWVTKASFVAKTESRQAYCSLMGYVNPTNVFGMYLPVTHWNGRYLVRGCGGSCGNAAVELACGLHLRDGYACLITDMGHTSTTIDNNWVDNNLQGLVDFSYRSTHVTTVAGKAIATAFYGRSPIRSYFFACSTGGRQGMIEAERFPEDFDGIVAIAPASMGPFGSKRAATVSDVDAFNSNPDGSPILPGRKAMLIHAAVVRACDGNDGVKDGLIGDPRLCRWEPEAIACKAGGETRDCLTAAQVAVVHKMYGWRGAMKGSELNWIGNFIRSAPLPGEGWKPLFDLGVGRGDPTTIETMINPNNPDLRPFRDNGGKLILVQGWSDYSVMPPPTLDYYQTMTKTMDGPVATKGFARLFMIPGMDHCAGGEGASAIDYMGAITSWVEGGNPTESLHGVHTVPGAPLDYFGVGLPYLDRKYYAFERDHHAFPGASVASGKDPVAAPDNRPLAERLADAVRNAEAVATGAGYPRSSTLNMTQRAIWDLFYRSGADSAAQTAALAAVAATNLDPIAREAVARMRAELALG